MNPLPATKRLGIALVTSEDADSLVDMLMKPDLYTVIGDAPADRHAAHDRVRRWVGGSQRSDTRWINAVVRPHESGHVVGMCQATVSLDATGAADECVIGYLVDPDHHGRGIGREMMTAFTEHLAAELTPRVITAHIAPGHIPSERVAHAVGLRLTTAVDDDGEGIWSATSSELMHR